MFAGFLGKFWERYADAPKGVKVVVLKAITNLRLRDIAGVASCTYGTAKVMASREKYKPLREKVLRDFVEELEEQVKGKAKKHWKRVAEEGVGLSSFDPTEDFPHVQIYSRELRERLSERASELLQLALKKAENPEEAFALADVAATFKWLSLGGSKSFSRVRWSFQGPVLAKAMEVMAEEVIAEGNEKLASALLAGSSLVKSVIPLFKVETNGK